MAIVKWIHQYRKGPTSCCLGFGSSKPLLEGFTDSDMSANVDTNWSTSGYDMTYAGGAVLWQKSVALSTTEAEYMASVEVDKEII